ncbi:MAG: TolC family outer membrane protein [Gammaproteobacteria bacterium]|nr:TolC family outer membrane protein [Gammaproteobacteria bacterium]
MKPIKTLFLGAALAFAPFTVSALDLLEAYELALANDPEYLAAQAANRAAQEARPQALAGLLPNAQATGNTSYNDQESSSQFRAGSGSEKFNSHGYQLSLRQPVFRWDRWVQLEQADLSIQQANAVLDAAHQDLIQRITSRYLDVLRAEDNLEFVRKTKEAIGRQLNQAEQRFEVGLIAITDVEEAKAAYDLAVTDEIRAENDIANAHEALREIIGEYHDEVQGFKDDLPLERPDPEDIDAWTAIALEQNLNLQAAQFAAENAREEIRRRSADGHYPTLDVVASRSYNNSGGGNFGGSTNKTDAIGLELAVPLYSGGFASSRVEEARHLYRQATDQREQARRAAQRLARDAYLGVLADISRIKAFKQSLVSTQTALKATEAGFQVGTRTTVDVVNAQVDRFRASRDLAASRYDYVINSLALKLAAGTLSPEDIEYFSSWLEQ